MGFGSDAELVAELEETVKNNAVFNDVSRETSQKWLEYR
jgi:hypothetical protein